MKCDFSSSIKVYFNELSRYPVLPADEVACLARRVREGDRSAFEKLVNHNLLYVVNLALPLADWGVPLEDLIGEGNLGLLKAVERYDERRGLRFTTYAKWCIMKRLLAAIKRQKRYKYQQLPDVDVFSSAFCDNAFDSQEETRAIQRSMSKLPENKRRVIELNFGFADGEKHKLVDIANELGKSVETIRLWRNDGLRQLSLALCA